MTSHCERDDGLALKKRAARFLPQRDGGIGQRGPGNSRAGETSFLAKGQKIADLLYLHFRDVMGDIAALLRQNLPPPRFIQMRGVPSPPSVPTYWRYVRYALLNQTALQTQKVGNGCFGIKRDSPYFLIEVALHPPSPTRIKGVQTAGCVLRCRSIIHKVEHYSRELGPTLAVSRRDLPPLPPPLFWFIRKRTRSAPCPELLFSTLLKSSTAAGPNRDAGKRPARRAV
jgi:hypothetical protein